MLSKLVDKVRDCVGGATRDIPELLELTAKIGLDRNSLEVEIIDFLEERILMWLIGPRQGSMNFSDRKRHVENRLKKLIGLDSLNSTDTEDDIVTVLARLHADIEYYSNKRKQGIGDIGEAVATYMLKSQNYRCAVCGIPLRDVAVTSCDFFKNGVEPIAKLSLDHIIPFYLMGDAGQYQILCVWCNSLKNDRIGVQEDGFVFTSNHLRERYRTDIKKRMAFWTIARSPKCEYNGCLNSSKTSILWVRQRNKLAAWTYGNLAIECTEHASKQSWYLHSDNIN